MPLREGGKIERYLDQFEESYSIFQKGGCRKVPRRVELV